MNLEYQIGVIEAARDAQRAEERRQREKAVAKRIAGERAAIRQAVRLLKTKGWLPVRVWDGEENVATDNERDVMEAVFSVDESRGRFRHLNYAGTHCFCVVLGNSPAECIADASMGEGWDEAMELVWAHLESLDA